MLASGDVARGVFVCISPWNFPLAIFTGQIVAALVAGNPVIAKPAEQTPLIAARAVQMMLDAGIPGDVLQFVPGPGRVIGARLVSDAAIKGVCFTGSTGTAQMINRALADNADPEAPLIAETGGLNAMIVDSSALPEQAVRDIVASAFQSAGQRCSALRALFVQEDIADKLVTMLKGAMEELTIGNPWDISVDVGPVIDAAAKATIDAHCEALEAKGQLICKIDLGGAAANGTYVSPAVYRLNGIHELETEIFGPILHVVTFRAADVSKVVDKINATGYGLTLGVHTRVDTRVQEITDKAHVGNLYVNRNQIGAVVGVQPFGGEGLSGTGPKAGGPLYLHRFMKAAGADAHGSVGTTPAAASAISEKAEKTAALVDLAQKSQGKWDRLQDRVTILRGMAASSNGGVADALNAALENAANYAPASTELVGPTGESNRLSLHGRGVILCHGHKAIAYAAMALLTGNGAVLIGAPAAESKNLLQALKKARVPGDLVMISSAALSDKLLASLPSIAGVATSAADYDLRSARQSLAKRDGAILPLITRSDRWQNFVVERALCIDTTASGGNATLLAANEA